MKGHGDVTQVSQPARKEKELVAADRVPKRIGAKMVEAHKLAAETPGIDAEILAAKLSPWGKVAEGMRTVRNAMAANMLRADSGRMYALPKEGFAINREGTQ